MALPTDDPKKRQDDDERPGYHRDEHGNWTKDTDGDNDADDGVGNLSDPPPGQPIPEV